MEVLDGRERVFINCITVIEVADYKGINGLKLRKQAGEHTQAVHIAQRLSGVGLHQQACEMLPKFRRAKHGHARTVKLRFHQRFGCAAQRKAMAGHHFEKPQKQKGIAGNGGGMTGKDMASDDRKVGVRQTRPPVLIERVKARTRGCGFIDKPGRQLVNHPRLAEIAAHPIRRRELLLGHSDAARRRLRLRVITQLVVISSIVIVKKATRIREKAKGLLAPRRDRAPAKVAPAASTFRSFPTPRCGRATGKRDSRAGSRAHP